MNIDRRKLLEVTVNIIKSNTMNGQVDQLQASRLRQILFPRKAKPTRSLVSSCIEQSKENKETNTNLHAPHASRHSSLRDQISKLKQGIQLFVDKHMLNENYLTTPRECLELIKCMSEGMVNYYGEIEQAVATLIESIPKPLAKVMPMSKYFLMGLKFSYLGSLYHLARRRVLSEGFTLIKNEHTSRKAHSAKQQQHAAEQANKLDLLILNKLNRGFNRWRINVHFQNKLLIEKYYIGINQQMNSMLHTFSDESQIILYLQQLLHQFTNADAIEILLYNPKANMLRGYKVQNENLGPVFESVRENSYISETVALPHADDMEATNHSARRTTKTIELKLDHSLTKICIVKRQLLAVEQMRKDPDYASAVDDYTIFYGLTARDTLGSCIFTPLVGKSGCVGVIRQYFYNKVGERPNAETVSMVALVLENSIKTSQRFEQAKQKSLTIRNLYYLKAILVLNNLEQDSNDQHQQVFYSLINKYYGIKFMAEYPYSIAYSLDNLPHLTVHHAGDDPNGISSIVAALSKMVQHQSYFLYDHDYLYFMLESKVVLFQLSRDRQAGNQHQKQNQEHVPVSIVMQLLEKKQLIRIRKQKQFQQLQAEQQKLRRQEQNRKISEKKNKILQFCSQERSVQNQDDLMSVVQGYLQHFSKEVAEKSSKVEIEYKNKAKNGKVFESATTLYEDENLRIYVDGRLNKNGQSQQQQTPEHMLEPLFGLCASMIAKIKKPYQIPNFDHIHLKAQTYYTPGNIESGLLNLLKDVMQLSEAEISGISSANPFSAQTYCCFTEKKNLMLQSSASFFKTIKNNSLSSYSGLNPVSTVMYLGNQFFVVIHKYVDIKEDSLLELRKIYEGWRTFSKQHQNYLKNKQKESLFLKGIVKANTVVIKKILGIFYLVKNSNMKIRFLPDFLHNFVLQQNRTALNYALSMLRGQKQRNIVKLCDLNIRISKLTRTIYNLTHIQNMFLYYRNKKQRNQALSRLCWILRGTQSDLVQAAFNKIYLKKNLINTNNLSSLLPIFNRSIAPSFQLMKRFSKAKESLGIIQSETECSLISKMDSLHRIFSLVRQKFDNFQFFLCLKNGAYLSLQLLPNRINVVKEFRDRPNFQYFQFSSQSKSQIRNIVWLVPQTYTVSLIEKHYLQVLSRAIEEGFAKFVYKNQQFLSLIHVFTVTKTKKLVQKALKNLRWFTMSKIKVEQYSLRDQYYEASIEVENFRLMQKQQSRQQEQRMKQISQSVKMKQMSEGNLSQCRRSIVRLQISSKKLQEAEVEQRLQKQRKQMIQAFNAWRVEAAYRTKYAQRRSLARKKQSFACNSFLKVLKQIMHKNYKYCHQRIMIESAHVRARDLSAQKQPFKQSKELQPHHPNRLLTFQDELNELTQRDGENKKEVSIIPISFKHFEGSKKQNYDVTDDDMKKVNGGAYKLNAKTLKFLKRMGKLNN